jgi:hypothetical protein
MAEDVEIPKLGKAPKKILIPALSLPPPRTSVIGTGKPGTEPGADAGTVADGEFGAVDSSIPGVLGAVSPTNSYGSGDTGNTGDTTSGPGHFKTNGEWTDYVVGKLSQSDTWSYTDIVIAIGNGLAGRPTTTAQQDILRAAIAVGGQPPEGAIVIVPGGNTGITVAPDECPSSVGVIDFRRDRIQRSFRCHRLHRLSIGWRFIVRRNRNHFPGDDFRTFTEHDIHNERCRSQCGRCRRPSVE